MTDHFLREAPNEPLYCDWFIAEHFAHLGYVPLADCDPVMSVAEDGTNIIDMSPAGFGHFLKIPRGREQVEFGNAVGEVILDQSLTMRFTSINCRYRAVSSGALYRGDGYIMLTSLADLAKLKMLILQVTEDFGYRFV